MVYRSLLNVYNASIHDVGMLEHCCLHNTDPGRTSTDMSLSTPTPNATTYTDAMDTSTTLKAVSRPDLQSLPPEIRQKIIEQVILGTHREAPYGPDDPKVHKGLPLDADMRWPPSPTIAFGNGWATLNAKTVPSRTSSTSSPHEPTTARQCK